MKHFSTFLVALMVAVSVFAAPQTKRHLLPLNHQLSTVNSQQSTLNARLSTANVKKRIPNIAAMARQTATAIPGKQVVHLAQKAQNNTINLNGGVFAVVPEYEAETGEWYMAVQSEGYTFRLCWYAPEDNYCGTFSFDDISWEWTWGWYQSADMFYEILLADINMTISENQVSKYLTQIILDATITDVNDRIYVLHIVHDMYTPKSTVETVLNNTQLTIGEGYYVLDGNDEHLDVQLAVASSTIDGIYTQTSFDMNGTKITYNGVEQQMLQAYLTVAGGMLEDGSLGYWVDFSFYNQDTILYEVTMPAPLPAVKDTINISCTNLVVDESIADYGFIMVTGSSDLYDIFAMYEATYAEAGVYEVSIAITDKITWAEPISAIRAVLTLTEETDGWHANIEAYGSDYNWYSIDMQYVVPEPTDTVKITFAETAIASFRPDQLNMLQLLSYSDDYEAGVTIYGIQLGESFTMDNVVLDYSGIYDAVKESSVAIADVKGTLNQYGDTTVITASIIGFDAIQYDVELWYAVPTPVDTIEIEMPVKFSNNMDYGYYVLSAYTPDSTWYISLSPMTDVVAGTFVNDGLFGKFGAEGGRYDFYNGDTFIYSQAEWTNYIVEKGTLVVEVAPNGIITAEADIICSNAIYYHIKMTSEYNTHLDYDEPEVAVDRTYTTEDNVTIDDQTAVNGYIYLALTAADGSDMAAFFFFAEESDPEIIIPEGTYPINASEEYGTVMANPGVQGDGVWPSFYAEMLSDGSIVVPLWLLVSGSVEVTKDDAGNPHLEVNAFNSYGVPVHIVYEGAGTGVENLKDPSDATNCQKRLVNGQLLIIRNGETFNAVGARIE